MDINTIIEIVVNEVKKELAKQQSLEAKAEISEAPACEKPVCDKKVVTQDLIIAAVRAGEKSLRVLPGAIITPLARELAEEKGIAIVRQDGQPGQQADKPANAVSAAKSKSVAIASDHGGFALKEEIKKFLMQAGYPVIDCGTGSTAAVDYPDLAFKAADAVSRGDALFGVIVDGAGIGSTIVANKVPDVRAALCHDLYTARNSREHNNANICVLGSLVTGAGVAKEIVQKFLETPFAGGRHQKRLNKIKLIENKFMKR